MMEKELFLDLSRYLKDISDQVALGGGEPTLFPELVEQFAQECKDYDLTCNLTTNGSYS
jgi:pyruvate-formate lyase-activating enzyme